MDYTVFSKYMQAEPKDMKYLAYAWSTAIGLQDVDGLDTSDYLNELAAKNIEGTISFTDTHRLLEAYYEAHPEEDTKESDLVSAKIADILSEDAFTFSLSELISIHRRLFSEVYSHAGKLREYNLTKKEWVLDGETVIYGTASELMATLEYDFSKERNFSYKGLSMDEIIRHLASFTAGLWQIHPFAEGNTRTTAVFVIKYLRRLGFDVTNTTFAQNAWYFRNALVRANYSDISKGIYESTEYLEKFFRNLILGENNKLSSKSLHVAGEAVELVINLKTRKSESHAQRLYYAFGKEKPFGRTNVTEITGLKPAMASRLIKTLLEKELIVPVKGHGKGKYVFK